MESEKCKEKNPPEKLSFVNSIMMFLVQFYQCFFSGVLGGTCRFYPTCSEYAKDCISSQKPGTAFVLILKRLLKCVPFGPKGLDPAPITKGCNK